MDMKKVPTQALVCDKSFNINDIKIDLETNRCNNKPYSALWTSTWRRDPFRIGWINWNIGVYQNLSHSFLKSQLLRLFPKKGIKLYEINNEKDFKNLPILGKGNDNYEWIQKLYYNYDCIYFDYKELERRGYSGLHVTDKAISMGRDLFKGFKEGFDPYRMAISGFDCESTVWFNNDWIKSFSIIEDDLIAALNRR